MSENIAKKRSIQDESMVRQTAEGANGANNRNKSKSKSKSRSPQTVTTVTEKIDKDSRISEITEDDDDDDDDCKIIEDVHPLIILDTTDVDMETEISNSQKTEDFLMKVQFNNKESFDQLSKIISKELNSILYSKQRMVRISEDVDNFVIIIKEPPKDDLNDMFIVDVAPSTKAKVSDVPEYDSTFTEVFNDKKIEGPNPDACLPPKRTNLCFNCDGNHSIRDCKEPKNYARIRENRAKFCAKVERYHVGSDQKYGHFLPGIISTELRHALGLKRNEMPLHIYRMRLCGYPPGWLEHAKISDSGLSLIDSSMDDSTVEETKEKKDKYDLKKIINFPGFNVKPKSGTIDDACYYRLPPMQKHQSKEKMLEMLNIHVSKSYKRRKLSETPAIDKTANREISEMEIEDMEAVPVIPLGVMINVNEPPLPPESSPPPPPPPENIPKSPVKDQIIIVPDPSDEERSLSPSLEDLAERKRLLLAALEDSTLLNSTVGDDSLLEHILENDTSSQTSTQESMQAQSSAAGDSLKIPNTAPIQDIELVVATTSNESLTTNKSKQSEPGTPANSKHAVLGTPLLESVTSFLELPKSEKWSVGVSEVIDFENLPESTGKYETMRTLLNRVRTVVKRLNSDD